MNRNLDALVQTARSLASALKGGKKILLFGNGGSAADAQHLAAEFVNRYLMDRPPLPAVALTTDSSVITSISNDFSYDEIFEKQIRALGQSGDVAVGISTSGRSRNVLRALETAREKDLLTVGIGGPVDGPMRQLCDHYLFVEGASTPRVQEVHMLVGHTLVELVDEMIFGRGKDREL